MVQIRLSALSCLIFLCIIFFSFCFVVVLFLIMCFLLACFPLFSQGFCDKRTSNNVYIILVHSSTVHALYIEIWSTWKVQWTLKKGRKMITHLLKFHTRSARIRGFPLEFVTLRVTQFVLKIAHLAISMEPRTCCFLLWHPDYGSWL